MSTGGIDRRRVVVTGAGVVSSIGVGADAFWDALVDMRSGARMVEIAGGAPLTACPAPVVDADERFGKKEARRMDRVGRMAAFAAALALDDAGDLGLSETRVGASVGCCHGGTDTLDAAFSTFHERGGDRISPFAIPLLLPNTAASAVARANSLRGPSAAPATACAAGSDAIGFAFERVRAGLADAMVAGGAEAGISPVIVAGYRQLGALSSTDRPPAEASRPFDRARDGFVMGEGAGFLIVEDLEHARARAARIYCEIVGYGQSCDAAHLTDPDPAGAGPARAIAAALTDAGRAASEVGYVNAHATATPTGDRAELRALVAAGLGGAAVSATKSLHGHTLGAAGGVEAVATLLAFARNTLPATANLDDPDPEPVIDHVREPRPARVDLAISNSFGFGGHNAALVFARI